MTQSKNESHSADNQIRMFAYYLPQFHPIPENDEWWGKGFTEWTNTAKAKPLFWGHYQPHIPADLSFYDLRVAETREEQAKIAKFYGIEGFCYYHYWFAGRRILERPFQEILRSGEPDFPFCLCWANETWSGVWHGLSNRILIEQTYPGSDDHRAHFDTLLPAFMDRRYARVNNKPIFLVYLPEKLPNPQQTLDLWRELAVKAGLDGLHLVAVSVEGNQTYEKHGFDATVRHPLLARREWQNYRNPLKRLKQKYEVTRGLPTIHKYDKWWKIQMLAQETADKFYPCVVHAWDNTPRSGTNGLVLQDATPEFFRNFLRATLIQSIRSPSSNKLVFLKSWNEWAEGNHLEPDLKFGHAFLQVVRDELDFVQSLRT